MPYKNPTELLVAATKLPAAIEAKLPAGAPKISATLVDIANKLPVVPDLPVELPDLPALPEFPTLPELPGMPGEMRRMVTGVEVRGITPVTRVPAVARRAEEEVVRLITP